VKRRKIVAMRIASKYSRKTDRCDPADPAEDSAFSAMAA
jgi:hypothetical protein